MGALNDPEILAGRKQWDENIARRLPDLLEELLRSKTYGLGDELVPPTNDYGVYLFTSTERHEYVGRTGLTERARLSGGKCYSGFANRLKGHLTATHTSGSWAYKRTCVAFRASGRQLAGSRAANCTDPDLFKAFLAEIAAIQAMEFRSVAIGDETLSAVFEIYAATVLATPWNSFPTS